jgi:hypothetical protein
MCAKTSKKTFIHIPPPMNAVIGIDQFVLNSGETILLETKTGFKNSSLAMISL